MKGRGRIVRAVAHMNDRQSRRPERRSEPGDVRAGLRVHAVEAGVDPALHLGLHVDDDEGLCGVWFHGAGHGLGLRSVEMKKGGKTRPFVTPAYRGSA